MLILVRLVASRFVFTCLVYRSVTVRLAPRPVMLLVVRRVVLLLVRLRLVIVLFRLGCRVVPIRATLAGCRRRRWAVLDRCCLLLRLRKPLSRVVSSCRTRLMVRLMTPIRLNLIVLKFLLCVPLFLALVFVRLIWIVNTFLRVMLFSILSFGIRMTVMLMLIRVVCC